LPSVDELATVNLSKGFLLTLVVVLLVLSVLLLQPFLQYVLGAVLLAYVFYPLQLRLEAYVSPMVAALSLVVLAVVGFVVPLVVVLATIIDRLDRLLRDFDADAIPIEEIESRIARRTGQEVDIAGALVDSARAIGRVVLERSTDAFGTIAFHLVGIVLALFLVYYLLTDRADLLDWLYRTVPLPRHIQRDLYAEINDVIWGALFGHVFVGVVQGVVAGIGLLVTGVPNALFWTIVMIVFAMVPIVGAVPIWGGAVVYLFVTDDPLLAAGLFVYSVIVVGLTDDYLRPFAVARYTALNPAVILVGILGGAYAFGVMGLFFGPVILGALKATLRVGLDNWNKLEAAHIG
jgi:predicted PurR-regulated permease PerM